MNCSEAGRVGRLPRTAWRGRGVPGQVHGEGLSYRDHAGIGSDRNGIADLVDRQDIRAWIVVYEIVEPPRSKAIADSTRLRERLSS